VQDEIIISKHALERWYERGDKSSLSQNLEKLVPMERYECNFALVDNFVYRRHSELPLVFVLLNLDIDKYLLVTVIPQFAKKDKLMPTDWHEADQNTEEFEWNPVVDNNMEEAIGSFVRDFAFPNGQSIDEEFMWVRTQTKLLNALFPVATRDKERQCLLDIQWLLNKRRESLRVKETNIPTAERLPVKLDVEMAVKTPNLQGEALLDWYDERIQYLDRLLAQMSKFDKKRMAILGIYMRTTREREELERNCVTTV